MKSNNKRFEMVTVWERNIIVCDDGRCWIEKYSKAGRRGWLPVMFKAQPSNHNYVQAMVSGQDGKLHPITLHKVLALAFIPNPDGYKEIDHIDGDPTNNSLDNIRWCSRSTNNKNRTFSKESQTHIRSAVLCIETGERYNSLQEASMLTGIEKTQISRACKNGQFTCHGKHYTYVDNKN